MRRNPAGEYDLPCCLLAALSRREAWCAKTTGAWILEAGSRAAAQETAGKSLAVVHQHVDSGAEVPVIPSTETPFQGGSNHGPPDEVASKRGGSPFGAGGRIFNSLTAEGNPAGVEFHEADAIADKEEPARAGVVLAARAGSLRTKPGLAR